ncbi:MAG: hypothetical protein L7S06_00670 [Candidatus Actinomarina sp.]|nr:hypothetical protein [Candidatus Actinomarina sp.]
MIQIYLKSKRAIRFLFYKHLSITDQLTISGTLDNQELIKQYWLLNKADRHHSIEVMNRTKNFTEDIDLLKLSLLHDIGKNKAHYSWFLRIFSELKVLSSRKAKNYLDHEAIGLNVLENIDDIQVVIDLYKNDLLNSRHQILDKTDY